MKKVIQATDSKLQSIGEFSLAFLGVKSLRPEFSSKVIAPELLKICYTSLPFATMFFLAFSVLSGCGILEPNYKKYAEACSKTCDGSQAAFDANLSIVATDCAGCHSTTAIKGKNLSTSDAAKNRTTMLGFVKSGCQFTAELLTNKLTGGSHGGGLKNDPTLSQVQTWLAAEKACNQ